MSTLDAALVKRNQVALQQAAPLFDDLNHAWSKIEAFFRSKGILRDVAHGYAPIVDWGPAGEEELGGELIGIQKIKGKWRICHGVQFYDDPSGRIKWTPVTDCSTELRIGLLEHLNDLFQELVKSNEDYIPKIEQAVAKAHDVLAQLGIADET